MTPDPESLALRMPAPCVCRETPLCNQHRIAAALIVEGVSREREACAVLADAILGPGNQVAKEIRDRP